VRDSDLAKVGPALKRAAAYAKRLALQSGTPFYVWKGGRVVDLGVVGPWGRGSGTWWVRVWVRVGPAQRVWVRVGPAGLGPGRTCPSA